MVILLVQWQAKADEHVLRLPLALALSLERIKYASVNILTTVLTTRFRVRNPLGSHTREVHRCASFPQPPRRICRRE